MQVRAPLSIALVVLAACGGERGKGAGEGRPAGDTATAAAPAGPQAVVTVLYNMPTNPQSFETYYGGQHLPLLNESQQEIGFTRAELTRFVSDLDGTPPKFYRQAELYFDSMEKAKAGMATPAFKRVADDLPNFAKDGFIALVAEETGEPGTAQCKALATVIYETPKDTAAFERYYEATHLPLVDNGRPEIGFVRADFTRFVSNADGSTPPAKYRQAELCFESMDALRKGLATPAFMAVGHDLPAFATGGLTGLIGEQ